MSNKVDIRITANARQATTELGKLGVQLQGLSKRVTAIGHMGVAFLGFGQLQQGLSTLTRTVDEMTNLRSRLLLVEQTTIGVSTAFSGLAAIARDSRSSLAAVGDVYYRMAKGGEALGLSQQHTLDLTRTITQAMKLSGSSAQSAEAALMQFGQALQSGTLRGAELNSVLQQAPALAEAIAKGMGREVGDLKRLAEQGKISVEAIVEALRKSAPDVERQFRLMAPTIADAFTDLHRELGLYVDRLDKATGASTALGTVVRSLAFHLDGVAIALQAAAVTGLGGYIGRMVLAAQATLHTRTALVSASVAAAGLQARLLLAGTAATGAASKLAASTAALRALSATTRGFMGIIGGWPGLIITALLGGVAAWMQWGEAAESASERAASALQRVRALALESGRSEIEVLRSTLDAARSALTDAESRMASAQQRFATITAAAQASRFAAPQETPELRDARAAVAQAKGDIKTLQDELARLETAAASRAQREASETWKTAYLTRKEQLAAALANLDQMYASEQSRLQDNAAALQQLALDYERKRAELMRGFADRPAAGARGNSREDAALSAAETARQRRLAEIQNELRGAQNDMLRMTGQAAEALGNELVTRYASVIADLRAQGDEAGASLIEKLIGMKVADERLAELKEKVTAAFAEVRERAESIFDTFARAEQSAANQVDIGELSPGAARDTVSTARQQALDQYRALRAELEAIARQSPEAAAALEAFDARAATLAATGIGGLKGALADLRKELDTMQRSFAGDALSSLRDGLSGLFADLATRSKSAKEAVKDFVRGFAEAMVQITARIIATAAVLAMFNAIPGGSALLSLAGLSAKVAHAGGVAGEGGTARRVPGVVFASAARYHTGGIAGLQPGEVPAILRRGEEVITESDPRHIANGGAAGAPLQSVRINLLDDRSNIGDYISSSSGERVIMEVLERNQSRLRTLIG